MKDGEILTDTLPQPHKEMNNGSFAGHVGVTRTLSQLGHGLDIRRHFSANKGRAEPWLKGGFYEQVAQGALDI